MRRLLTILASFTSVAGLVACCCPARFAPVGAPGGGAPPVANPGGAPGDVRPPDPAPPIKPGPINPQGDAGGNPAEAEAVALVRNLGGSVSRDDARPVASVIEVNLTFTKTTDADLKGLAALTRLHKLVLTQDAGVTGAGLKSLGGLQQLEHLELSGSALNDEGAGNVGALRSLKVLNVSATKISDAAIKEIARLEQLQELTAGGVVLSDKAVQQVGALKHLRKLDLSNTQTGDLSARAIAGLDQLKVLHVYGTDISDAGMMELARLTGLEELKIGYRVTDVGVSALAGPRQLQVLSLWNCTRVGDGCVPTLSALTNLRELDLNKTKITVKGKQEIRKSLPGCKVKF
jgi:hypothetical protein